MRQSHAQLLIRLLLLGLFFCAAFVYGLMVLRFELWPAKWLKDTHQVVVSLLESGQVHPKNRLQARPSYAARQSITINPATQRVPGMLAIMGFDNYLGHEVIWLFDEQGKIRHRWPIDYHAIAPDGPPSSGSGPHGLLLLPDGSVVVTFNVDRYGIARLDACGTPLWVKKGTFHHSVDLAGDGHLWTWGADGSDHAQQQYLVKLDRVTGATLRTISLIEDVIKSSDRNRLAFSIPDQYRFKSIRDDFNQRHDDIFHPNDLEELSTANADGYPDFKAGDLLLSLRTLDLILVLDPDTLAVKWAHRGPWLKQHDPDFGPDGRISVFSNSPHLQFSSIIRIDPQTRQTDELFTEGNARFYTKTMGSHQRLPGGGAIIVASRQGRVLEVDRRGEVLFEFNNRATDTMNAVVQNAQWLPPDFFARQPHCPGSVTHTNRH